MKELNCKMGTVHLLRCPNRMQQVSVSGRRDDTAREQ
jgi:hypothetical protein